MSDCVKYLIPWNHDFRKDNKHLFLLTYHVYVLMIENSSLLINKFPDDANCY